MQWYNVNEEAYSPETGEYGGIGIEDPSGQWAKREDVEALQAQLDSVITERDTARKSVCEMTTMLTEERGSESLSPRQNAKQLGWGYLYMEAK
jgi:hypothetical protein